MELYDILPRKLKEENVRLEEIEEIKEVASEIVEELIDAVDGDSCEEEII